VALTLTPFGQNQR